MARVVFICLAVTVFVAVTLKRVVGECYYDCHVEECYQDGTCGYYCDHICDYDYRRKRDADEKPEPSGQIHLVIPRRNARTKFGFRDNCDESGSTNGSHHVPSSGGSPQASFKLF